MAIGQAAVGLDLRHLDQLAEQLLVSLQFQSFTRGKSQDREASRPILTVVKEQISRDSRYSGA